MSEPITREEFEELKAFVAVNTRMVAEIHELLVDFRGFRRIIKTVLKWATLASGASTAIVSLYHTYIK